MAMIYAIIIRERAGKYGNTDFTKAGEAIFRQEYRSNNRLF